MARFDKITRNMVSLSEDDIKQLQEGKEIKVALPDMNLHIRLG